MGQYIGARYVPKFMGLYDATQAYENLCVVDNGLGTSYISQKPTPAGTPLTDTTYWAVYGASSGAIINLQNQIDALTNYVKKYDVTRYGVVGDGATDNYAALSALMDDIYDNNGGIVYFPEGTYVISDTVAIPANTIVVGENHNSVIFFTGEHPDMGVALMPAGDNILINNITVNYQETSPEYLKSGSQLGSIGVTTKNYAKNTRAIDCPAGDVKHVIIDNVFSNNSSPLQCEPDILPNYVEDIRYQNCNFPNGQLRCSPTAGSAIKGMFIQNCSSKAIAIGYNSRTNNGIVIDNCITNYINIADNDVIVNNTIVKAVGVYRLVGGTPTIIENAVKIIGSNIKISNTSITCENPLVIRGVFIDSADTSNDLYFENVSINGFTTSFYDPLGTDCKFTNVQMDGTNVAVHGSGINCAIDYNKNSMFRSFDDPNSKPLQLETGITSIATLDPTVTIIGKQGHIKTVLVVNLAIDTTVVLGNINVVQRPSAEQTIIGYFFKIGTFNLQPLLISIATDGTVKVKSVLGNNNISASADNRIMIDSIYNL